MMEKTVHDIPTQKVSRVFVYITALFCLLVALGGFSLLYLFSAPQENEETIRISIEDGATVREVGALLKEHNVIRSPFLFSLFITLREDAHLLQAGDYILARNKKLLSLIETLTDGSARIPPIRVTIPEGATLAQFDALLTKALPRLHAGSIITAADHKEGVLFPDTYLIPEDASAEEIVSLLTLTFTKKLAPYRHAIEKSGFTEAEIITLASIVEREANDETSMRLVSGILQNRLKNTIPLQVDATFMYTLKKTSAELTAEDLASDSPFNTYKYTGLPPHPIASPSLQAIDAVLYPTDSEYLFYLTGNDGVFYYAETFEEHVRLKRKHIHS